MKPLPTYIDQSLQGKINELVRQATGEIGWCGLMKPILTKEGRRLAGVYVHSIYVPKQEVSGGSVDVAAEAQIEYMDILTANGRQEDIADIRYQGHSHVNMGCTPSHTDNECWDQWAFGGDNGTKITAFTIHNKKGESHAEIRYYSPELGIITIPSYLTWYSKSTADWVAAEIAAKCRETRQTFFHGGGGAATPFPKWDHSTNTWRDAQGRACDFQGNLKEPPPKKEETELIGLYPSA